MTQAKAQVYWEDVAEDQDVPELVVGPMTSQMMMKWGAAVGDYYQIHYDRDYAKDVAHLPSIIIHGTNKFGLLGELLTNWVGLDGWVRRINCSYRSMDYPGDTITCRGKVTGKRVENGNHLVDLEIWTENPKGERTTPATAVVILPTRG